MIDSSVSDDSSVTDSYTAVLPPFSPMQTKFVDYSLTELLLLLLVFFALVAFAVRFFKD